jgi:hypothetical protein
MAFRLRSQTPLKQEKSIEANIDFDKEEKSLSPSLTASSGAFNVKAGGTVTPKGGDFNAGLNFNKGGFSAGVGVSGMSKEKPNVTASIGYKKKF